MNIINLARLIDGKMLTKPQISSVESFVFTPNEAKLASAFFAKQTDKNTQKIAIGNGAYAIIFTGECEILSDEIAYIRVENLTRAIIELAKYFANEKELKFIRLSPISAQIARISNLNKFGTFLNDDVKENFVKIFSALNKSFVFGENIDLIATNFTQLEKNSDFELLSPQLFNSSFVFDDKIYRNLAISPFFLDEICGLLNFAKQQNFELKFGDLREFRHFEPIFINSKFEILPFGMSEKVLIFESDEMAFEAQIDFLQSYTRDEILIIRDQFELLALQSKEYKYALILGKSSDFGEILHVRNDEFNLFE